MHACPVLLFCAGMNGSCPRSALLMTHGAAILLGFGAWLGMVWNRREACAKQTEIAAPLPRPHGSEAASAWIEDSLRKARENEAEEQEHKEQKPGTLAELLKQNREKAEASRKQLSERVERIVRAAQHHPGEADPASAICVAIRASSGRIGEPDDSALVIVQAWLDRNPDGVLTELGRNCGLLREKAIPAMLERKFGRKWMLRQIGDDGISFRLRTALTSGLGSQIAALEGFSELLQHYNLIADLRLKTTLVSGFAEAWPMDEPAVTARFLTSEAPVELRNQLLAHLERRPNDSDHEWFEKLCDAMGPDCVPERYRKRTAPPEPERSEPLSSTASIDQVIDVRMKDGMPRDKAAEYAISSKLSQVMDEGTDLMELYGEGRISRRELLEELGRRVPEAESYPEALERAAWAQTAMASEPQQVLAWAADLSKRGEIEDLMEKAFTSSSMFEDPRILQRVAHLQNIASRLSDGPLQSRVRDCAAYQWSDWSDISPATAEAWKDALPADDPLRAVLSGKAAARQREGKESP